MLGHPQIRMKPLADLCRRVSTSLETGVDARKVWEREAERAVGAGRHAMEQIASAVQRGDSLTEALADIDGYFPEVVIELVEVGESAGKLPDIFLGLADHYDHLVELRRVYLLGILWPALQLGIAIVVVGLLILLMGMIGQTTGEPIDILGWGLMGTRGLAIYTAILLGLAATVWLLIQSIARGWIPRGPWVHLMLRVPGLGQFLRTSALARMAWTMSLATETDMDTRKVLTLGLRSTQNPLYVSLTDAVSDSITRGTDITTALKQTGQFPRDFLDGIAVGEETGRMTESLRHLFEQYKARTQAAAKAMAAVAAIATWGLVGLVIVFMIFRLFQFYVGMIYQAMEPL